MNKTNFIIKQNIIKNLQKIIDNHKFSIECNPDDSEVHKQEINELEQQIEYLQNN